MHTNSMVVVSSTSGSRRPLQHPQPGSAKSTANTTHRVTPVGPVNAPRSLTTTTTSNNSSGSNDVGVQVRTLDLEAAEQAEQLLCRLQRNISLQREYSRRLVYLWMDLLSEEQHVEGILAAYPYMIKTPAGVHVCARAVS
jgi:hypothetical protein